MTRASRLTAIVVAVCGSGQMVQMVVQGPSAAPPVALEQLTAGKTLIEMELKNGFAAGVKLDRELWRN